MKFTQKQNVARLLLLSVMQKTQKVLEEITALNGDFDENFKYGLGLKKFNLELSNFLDHKLVKEFKDERLKLYSTYQIKEPGLSRLDYEIFVSDFPIPTDEEIEIIKDYFSKKSFAQYFFITIANSDVWLTQSVHRNKGELISVGIGNANKETGLKQYDYIVVVEKNK